MQTTAVNMNIIQIDTNIVNSFSCFLICYTYNSQQNSICLKTLSFTFEVDLIDLSVLLLPIKISQWTCENFDSYCKITL